MGASASGDFTIKDSNGNLLTCDRNGNISLSSVSAADNSQIWSTGSDISNTELVCTPAIGGTTSYKLCGDGVSGNELNSTSDNNTWNCASDGSISLVNDSTIYAATSSNTKPTQSTNSQTWTWNTGAIKRPHK